MNEYDRLMRSHPYLNQFIGYQDYVQADSSPGTVFLWARHPNLWNAWALMPYEKLRHKN